MTNHVYNIIQEIFNSYDCHNNCFDEFDDFEEEGGIQLESKDLKIIKCLVNQNHSKWTNKMVHNALNIIDKYSQDIENYLQINLKEHNIKLPEVSKSKHQVSIEENMFKIHQELNLDVENSFQKNEFIYFNINYNNIFTIIKAFNDGLLYIPQKEMEFINTYLNDIDYEKESIYKKHDNPHYDIDLFKFQEVGITYGLLNKEVIIGDEMGLGKTVQALSIVSLTNTFPLFIFTPKSLKYKWEKECKKLNNVEVHLFDKKNPPKNIEGNKIFIFTYDELTRNINKIETLKNYKSVIFDESHFLKNRKTNRSKYCKRISANADRIIELSGSPILNRVSELIYQIDIVKKMHLFGSNIDFTNKYCLREKLYKREDFETFNYEEEKSNLKELSLKMRQNFYIRRKKEQVLKELPEKRRELLLVDIENRNEYKKLIQQIKKETDNKIKKRLLSQLKKVAGEGKISAIKEQVNDYLSNNEKVVVFAYHKQMQQELLKEFPNALTLFKEQSEKERFEAQEKFQNSEEHKIIICSIKVAHAGFDLFSASNLIMAEMDWVPDINKQCEDRVHRIGQFHPVNIIYIIAKNTIEERLVEVNLEKMKIITEVNQEEDNFSTSLVLNSIKNEILDEI